MGMDVIGLKPATPAGEYFRRNVWRWRPLAEIVCTLEPELTAACRYWHSNDADGLDAETSKVLSDALQHAVATGRVQRLVAARDKRIAKLPRRQCSHCSGTGIRCDEVGIEHGQPDRIIGPDTGATPDHPRFGQTGWCNGCAGYGNNEALEANYHVTVDDVGEFADFLAACGGFEIH